MTTAMRIPNFRLIAILMAVLASFLTILFVSSSVSVEQAFAQGAGGQYPDGDVGPGGGGGGDSDLLPDGGGGDDSDLLPDGGDGGPGDDGDEGGAGDGDGGKLPFTGYPLSTLVLILIVLLLTGLTLRASLAVRDRLRNRSAS